MRGRRNYRGASEILVVAIVALAKLDLKYGEPWAWTQQRCALLGVPPHFASSEPIQLRIYAGQLRNLAPLASHSAKKVTAS